MTRKHLLAAGAIVLLLFAGMREQRLSAITTAPSADVLIAYASAPGARVLRSQWDVTLERQGVPHKWVALSDFGVLDGAALAHRFSLIVIPRAVSRVVPDTARAQFIEFAQAGGRVVTSSTAASLRDFIDGQKKREGYTRFNV